MCFGLAETAGRRMKNRKIEPQEIIKIRCTEEVLNIYAKYRPKKGKIYNAIKGNDKKKVKEFVIVPIEDKNIVLRLGEYEIVGL